MPESPRTAATEFIDPAAILRHRWRAGLTQAELAELAGITDGQLSKIENGKSGAGPGTLRKLAEALGCAVADFERPRIPA
jgi:transcriptional regulator with XRE-family HTH domain